MNEADIICTNPPFSRFRQFVSMLMSHKKKFLIIGNMNAIGFRDFFPLLKNNEIWMGYNHVEEFMKPDGTVQKFGNIRWYTNLNIPLHHENMNSKCKYDPQHYPRFENYNAINVDRLSEIPYDYTGTMGVPISYMEKYNPEQFQILGLHGCKDTMPEPVQLGDEFIRNYRANGGTGHYTANMYCVYYYDHDGKATVPYRRLFIQYTDEWIRKHPNNFKCERA